MKKIRVMIGMPVICRNKKIGRMIQADLAEDLRQMNGIWVDSGLRGTRYIPSENLEMLGEIAIIADDCGKRRRPTPAPIFHRAISTDGQRLGAITGAEINELSFAVESLELSNGIWEDILNRRDRINRYTVNRETGEIIIEKAGQEMEEVSDEEWHDQRIDYRTSDRRIGSYDFRRNELENREKLEHESAKDRTLDFKQS